MTKINIDKFVETAVDYNMNWEEFFSSILTYIRDKGINDEEYDDIAGKCTGTLIELVTTNNIKISFKHFIKKLME